MNRLRSSNPWLQLHFPAPLHKPSNLRIIIFLIFTCLTLPLAWSGDLQINASPHVRVPIKFSTQALLDAKRNLTANPNNAKAWARWARILYRNADFEKAEAAAKKAISLNPKNAHAHIVLARCLNTQGQHKEARKNFKRAFALDPLNPLAIRMLAGALDLNKDRKRVLELTRRFVKFNPPDQALFVEHLSKMLDVVKALNGSLLKTQPPWKTRPKEIILPLHLSSKGPKIEVRFGSLGARWCLFDTGEESITLSHETVRLLKAQRLSHVPTATATGIEKMALVLIPKLTAGKFEMKNILAAEGTLDIIGPAMFRGYRVKIDLRKRKLVLTKQAEEVEPRSNDLKTDSANVSRIRFRKFGNMIWLPLSSIQKPGSTEKQPAWGLLDTGCEPTCVLTPRYLKALKSRPGNRGPMALPIRSAIGGAAGESGTPQIIYVLPQFQFSMLNRKVNADGALSTKSITSICKVLGTELDMIIGWPVVRKYFPVIEIDFERCVLTVIKK